MFNYGECQRCLVWGKPGHIKLWLMLNFMTKEAKCGQSQFVHVSASRKDEPGVQVRLVMLTLEFRKQDSLNEAWGFPSPSPPQFWFSGS